MKELTQQECCLISGGDPLLWGLGAAVGLLIVEIALTVNYEKVPADQIAWVRPHLAGLVMGGLMGGVVDSSVALIQNWR